LARLSLSYEQLLRRLRSQLGDKVVPRKEERLTLPEPDVIWVGNKTILRNYAAYPKILRREPNKLLMFLAKELATAASIDGERAIFIGRKEKAAFKVLFERYMKDYVLCPVCGNPDTKLVRIKRLTFLVCEACGAKSSVKPL
jgi:translation initiation factor 2 subunit 2